jgi:hypothetical protein
MRFSFRTRNSLSSPGLTGRLLFALSSAILALGGVFWLVRDQDRREEASNEP